MDNITMGQKKTENGISMGNRRRIKKIILFSVLGVAIALAAAAVIYIYPAIYQPENILTKTDSNPGGEPAEPNDHNGSGFPTPGVDHASESKIINILLMGIDSDYKSYAKNGGDYHTDSIIVLAVNFDKNTVDMISLPRDTFTHVPGIRGIYKLNAAINCGGGKTDDGFEKVCEAASWMLGGISVNYYCAFELDAVKKIGDMIDGVDFDVDMAYRGNSGTYYKKGLQHLDGTGIYDYMRARKNATGESGDKGRMNRGRAMLEAIFQKLKDQGMLTHISELIATLDEGTYTNMDLQQIIALANYAYTNIDTNDIGSYTMSGKIQSALGWDFSFTDQQHRTELINNVYGIDVPEQEYVSYDYANWLDDYGFTTTRYLVTADDVIQYIEEAGISALSAEQLESYNALKKAYKATLAAYETAALSLDSDDNSAMKAQRADLRNCTEELAKLVDYPDRLSWSVKSAWYADDCINEVNVNFQ